MCETPKTPAILKRTKATTPIPNPPGMRPNVTDRGSSVLRMTPKKLKLEKLDLQFGEKRHQNADAGLIR
ncbi:hypothetical protein LTS10_004341 [Elasticomyces elasticus]|nr:hypothetical protein LTS10_004341 [Elasticomyces elasticus]